jgi:hypothetical protein
VSIFSPFYATLVLYVIPCYLAYKFGGVALSYFFPKKASEDDKPLDKADAKRLAKKEKKQEKVRYVKH